MDKGWDIGDWYAAGALGISGELLERRSNARNALLNDNLTPALRAGAQVFASVKPVSDDSVAVLVGALKAADNTYSRINGEQDLRIFSAALIDAAPVADISAIAARLKVSCAAFGGKRTFGKLDKLIDASRAKLDAAAGERRADIPVRAQWQSPVIAAGAEPNVLQKNFETLGPALSDLANELIAIRESMSVRERVNAERLEILLLLQTGELTNGEALAKSDPAHAAVAIGLDLALSLDTPAMSGTVNRIGMAILRRAEFDPNARVTWKEVHAARHRLQLPGNGASTLPLMTLLKSDVPNFLGPVKEFCGVELVEQGEVTLAQLIEQALMERQTIRLWANA